MQRPNIHTIDLNFQGIPRTIGIYLIPHSGGGALIECGPGSTIPAVTRSLEGYGLTPREISDVFVTHIHLDHAGSAGWWARQGARVHVHPAGAPHLLDPAKLLASAGRIYGEAMGPLWGEFLPVPAANLGILEDGAEVEIGGRLVKALDPPGHANHHLAYLVEGVCFTGDVGGVRLPGIRTLRLPTVPPETHLETWRETIRKLRRQAIDFIAPTHFDLHGDVAWHFDTIEATLDALETFLADAMQDQPEREVFRERYAAWMLARTQEARVPAELIPAFELAISSQMSADGLYRYWGKFRAG